MSSLTAERSFRVVFIAAFLLYTLLRGVILYLLSDDAGASFTDAFLSCFLLFGSCLLMVNNMRYYLPQREKTGYTIILAVVIALLNVATAPLLFKYLLASENYDTWRQDYFLGIRFVECFFIATSLGLWALLWYSRQEQQQLVQHRAETARQARDAELFMLRQHLQPHFLFNSLNSISALVVTQPEAARNMIQQLSDFLRGTIKTNEKSWQTLQDEMKVISLYLDIEKIRFGYRLSSSIALEEESRKLLLPSLCLQPLVENAIKHGLYNNTGNIWLKICSSVFERQLVVRVSNPFDPTLPSITKGTGFGLESIRRRLYLLTGRSDLVNIDKSGNIFTVSIKIPQVHESYNY